MEEIPGGKKRLSREDIKHLDPKIDFAVDSAGGAADVRKLEIEERRTSAYRDKLKEATGKLNPKSILRRELEEDLKKLEEKKV